MKLTVDILDDFISNLDLSGNVNAFSDDGTSTTLEVSKTFHAREGMQLDVDGTDYPITAFVNNTSITVTGVIASPMVYTVPNPYYWHGTPMMTNNHISRADSPDKVPMVYLAEILRETDTPLNSGIRRESNLRLFFLDEANFENWDTDDHYTQRIVGLNNLVDAFVSQARENRHDFYLYETSFTRINHVKWGEFKDLKGHVKLIFDDHLSGVELSFTLPIINLCEC